RMWWESFESENWQRPTLVLRLAEELVHRNSTIADFHRAFRLSDTSDIQANLSYLDYLRLTTDEFNYETVLLDEFGKTTERRHHKARQFVEELIPGVTLEMVEIPGGAFQMGTAEEEVEKVIEEYCRYKNKREDAERW